MFTSHNFNVADLLLQLGLATPWECVFVFDCTVLVLTVIRTRLVRKDASQDVTQTANIPYLVLRDGESESVSSNFNGC